MAERIQERELSSRLGFAGHGFPSDVAERRALSSAHPRTPRRTGAASVAMVRRRMKSSEMVKMMPKPPSPEGESKPLKEILIFKMRVFISSQFVWCYLIKRKMGAVAELSTAHRELAQELKKAGSQRNDHACFRLGEEVAKKAKELGCEKLYMYRATLKSVKNRTAHHQRIVMILKGIVAQKLKVAVDVEDYRQRHEIPRRDWPEIQTALADFAEENPEFVQIVNLGLDPRAMLTREDDAPTVLVPGMETMDAYPLQFGDEPYTTDDTSHQDGTTFTGSFHPQPGVPAVPVNRDDYVTPENKRLSAGRDEVYEVTDWA